MGLLAHCGSEPYIIQLVHGAEECVYLFISSDTAFCMNPYMRRFYCFSDHELKDVKNVRVREYP